MSIEISDFGKDLNGNCVKLFSISNFNGLVAKVTNFGAVLVSLFVPDKNGNLADVVLGFDSLENYLKMIFATLVQLLEETATELKMLVLY